MILVVIIAIVAIAVIAVIVFLFFLVFLVFRVGIAVVALIAVIVSLPLLDPARSVRAVCNAGLQVAHTDHRDHVLKSAVRGPAALVGAPCLLSCTLPQQGGRHQFSGVQMFESRGHAPRLTQPP